jgi:hypothetical protein
MRKEYIFLKTFLTGGLIAIFTKGNWQIVGFVIFFASALMTVLIFDPYKQKNGKTRT